jgi:hypothetical protein
MGKTSRDLRFARARLIGASERIATFRRLGCINSNDRALAAQAILEYYDALDEAWEAQLAAD